MVPDRLCRNTRLLFSAVLIISVADKFPLLSSQCWSAIKHLQLPTYLSITLTINVLDSTVHNIVI